MNQLLKEINEGLEESFDKVVNNNFITFQHNGYEYHIYKNKISDVQRLAEIEEELKIYEERTNFDNENDEYYHKLVGEYKELQEKTNWLYK